MKRNSLIKYLKKLPLSQGLTSSEIQILSRICSVHDIKTGKDILIEGDRSTSIYIILEGEVSILKFDKDRKNIFQIATLSKGDYFGEMSFYDNSVRSSTVKANKDCQVLEIPKKSIAKLSNANNIIDVIKFNIANQSQFFNRLRHANSTIVKTLQKEKELLEERNRLGNFFIMTVMQTSIVILVNHFIAEHVSINNRTILYSHWFVWIYLLIVALPCFIYIIFSKQKIASFGINLINLKKTVIETGSTILLVAIIFCFINNMQWIKIPSYFSLGFFMYLLHSIIQEFVAKGVMQTSLYQFYGDKKTFLAVLISSFLFSISHIHFGLMPVLITLIFGIILGLIYQHQKNIFGISLIHAILGYIAFSINII